MTIKIVNKDGTIQTIEGCITAIIQYEIGNSELFCNKPNYETTSGIKNSGTKDVDFSYLIQDYHKENKYGIKISEYEIDYVIKNDKVISDNSDNNNDNNSNIK